MSEPKLTREQIEKWRGYLLDQHATHGADRVQLGWLCDTALLAAERSCSRYKTPKQRVLIHHPDAFAEPNGKGWQVVVPKKYGRVTVIGYSLSNRRAAWYNAARQIEELS